MDDPIKNANKRFHKQTTMTLKNQFMRAMGLLFLLPVLSDLWLSSPLIAQKPEKPFAVIGYLPDYRMNSITPDSLQGVTDLIYFGFVPAKNGRLDAVPVPRDVLLKLHSIKQKYPCRILLSVGGWDRSQNFGELTAAASTRRMFIDDLVQYCRQNGFQGIDYDWEHPKMGIELSNYIKLLKETREACRPHGMIVTVAQAAWQDLGKEAYQIVDRVHLMAYDHEFPQATYAKTTKDIERVLGWGCPPGKLAMGIPFYGRNKQRQARTYAEILSAQQIDPARDLTGGYAYNGQTTVKRKVQYAAEKKLAGVMIWELGQDSNRTELGLLEAIRKQVKSAATGKE